MAHPIRERMVAYAQPQYSPADDIYMTAEFYPASDNIYVPAEVYPASDDIYIPAETYPLTREHVNMIHKTSFSKREAKKFSRDIKLEEVAMPDVPEFIDWSDQSIMFGKTDHPTAVPRPGQVTLVLEA
jgi:hypothetical protein